MKGSFPATLLITLLLSSCSGLSPVGTGAPGNDDQPEYATEFVVLVIIDGLRYSEGLGDPEHRYTPEMAALAAKGAIIEPFLNDGVTRTSRAIPAIWSGTWTAPEPFDDPDCGGAENIRAVEPTVFEYYRKHLERPAEDCVYAVGNVGCAWKASVHADYGTSFWPDYQQDADSDSERWVMARRILEEQKPGFLLFYLPDVDHGGHGGDWAEYTGAIATADAIVGQLWEFLDADPHYSGRTTMIVTNDHGRHDNRPDEPHNGFSGHGDGCPGCRKIQLLIIGPDTPAGLISIQPRSIPDITPTIGALLGFPTEAASGSAMLEVIPSSP